MTQLIKQRFSLDFSAYISPIITCHDAAQAKEPKKFIDGGNTGKSITLD